MNNTLVCSWCKSELVYLHGHAACVKNSCSMYGLNQAECCSGENIEFCIGTQQNEITLSQQRLQYKMKNK